MTSEPDLALRYKLSWAGRLLSSKCIDDTFWAVGKWNSHSAARVSVSAIHSNSGKSWLQTD